MNLYHKMTFGLLHSKQPAIMQLAKKLGRSSNSVAMKLCNFASLDPALMLRGIKGLDGASKLDREIWKEFHENPEMIPASEEAMRELLEIPEDCDLEVLPKIGFTSVRSSPSASTEVIATVKQRRGQEYFREAVINNFGGCCGITGLTIRSLLIASHILPWGKYAEDRLNVRNGLCLSRLHDVAFDRGLISFDDELRLVMSKQLKAEIPQRAVAENFGAYEGAMLRLPSDAALPKSEFLAIHRAEIFQK